jgi:hypothetical protein
VHHGYYLVFDWYFVKRFGIGLVKIALEKY